MRKPILISIGIFALILTMLLTLTVFEKLLNNAFNEPGGKTHTEIMLWKSSGYPQEPDLHFDLEINPGSKNIRVVYKIENKSDKVTQIQNSIDLAVVAGDANKIGDPGTTVWRWSQDRQSPKSETITLGPSQSYTEEIFIDREKVDINFQYYITAYYKGELVSQFKVIEGLYNK